MTLPAALRAFAAAAENLAREIDLAGAEELTPEPRKGRRRKAVVLPYLEEGAEKKAVAALKKYRSDLR